MIQFVLILDTNIHNTIFLFITTKYEEKNIKAYFQILSKSYPNQLIRIKITYLSDPRLHVFHILSDWLLI
jgi:hypothetical protein